MTSLIDDIKRDRGAGTQGRWQLAGTRHAGDLQLGRTVRLHWVGPDEDPVAGVFFDMKTGHGLPDARRIARVPDLEAQILRDAEIKAAAEKLAEASEKHIAALRSWAHRGGAKTALKSLMAEADMVTAIAAYRRAATGESE